MVLLEIGPEQAVEEERELARYTGFTPDVRSVVHVEISLRAEV